ncbi:MAG: hypothetical protein NTW25_02780, partial [Candidatus Kapabacteria bacterium]|nr:hypothetical protein [Candidatus Kapabacteria bacterium]
MKLILLLIILSSNLYSQSKLSIPESIDLGILSSSFTQNYYFEIENNTKDTFLIHDIYSYNDYPKDILYKGNSITSDYTFFSSEHSPRVILPNEKRALTYTVTSFYEDSISLSGNRLKTDFYFNYKNINSDSMISHKLNIFYRFKKDINKIVSTRTGFYLDLYMCPNSQIDRTFRNYLFLYNYFSLPATLDSVKIFGGDSIVNIYGLINNNPNIQYPNINYDTLPHILNKSLYLGWYFKPTGFYEKKAFIKMYVTSPDNNHIELLDSVYVRIKPINEGFIENTVNVSPVKAKVNKTISVKESFLLNGCSYNTIFLDSLSFTDWERDEINIYS